MMLFDLLEVCEIMVHSYGVHFTRMRSVEDEFLEFDLGLRHNIMSDEIGRKILNGIFENTISGIFYSITDVFRVEYVLFALPDSERESGSYVMIGPYRRNYMDELELNEMMQTYKIPLDLLGELREYYLAVPILVNYEGWCTFIREMVKRIYNIEGELEVRYIEENSWDEFMDFRGVQTVPALSIKLVEERYNMERELLHAVSTGNMEEALKLNSIFYKYKIAARYKDPIRNLRNLMITFNTLLRKAAEWGCVHPYHIDELSSRFAKKIETICSSEEGTRLRIEMVRKYCMIVKNYSVRGYTAIIQKVVNHIDLNLASDLSLKGLAEEYSVNSSYLSVLFKKEVGQTITAYINQQRLKQAILYLNTSDMQIQTIAAAVGILDVNYFSKMFKKSTGKTPSEYRTDIQDKQVL